MSISGKNRHPQNRHPQNRHPQSRHQWKLSPDVVLVVGAGLAGLFCALKLAPRPVVILSPAPIGKASSSAWAQGGMAAALAPGDSPDAHAADTLAAGAGLTDPVVAKLIATEGPARVKDLIALGVPFDRDDNGQLALSLEAAHSYARVARVAGDLAGREIMASLIKAVSQSVHISLHEMVRAHGLLQRADGSIGGVIAQKGDEVFDIHAGHVVLATGGSGGLFRVTTNPVDCAGQGFGMAARASALVADAEFIQFHPTAIDIGKDPAPLATEALRGEGAILINTDGRAFMGDYDRRADLAPRDIVARAVASELAAGRGALLDARTAIGDGFAHHFPTVYAACQSAGIDPVIMPIPISPAAHYHMGGIVSDLWGASSLNGLSVIGETSATGAHGANRLASNSLLEAVVFAHRTATRLVHSDVGKTGGDGEPAATLTPEGRMKMRTGMSQYAGVVRDKDGLNSLINLLDDIEHKEGLANELVTAQMIAKGALAREESRGGHCRADFPLSDEKPQRSFTTFGKVALSSGNLPPNKAE